MNFIILASPRSRTAWLSTWLSDQGHVCHHDLLAKVDDPLTLKDQLGFDNGTIETAGGSYYRTLFQLFPRARFLIVRRAEREIALSLQRHGVSLATAHLSLNALCEAEAWLRPRTNLMCVDFKDLSDERTLDSLWSHLRGGLHDLNRTRRLVKMRIERINPFWSEVAPQVLSYEQCLRQTVEVA